MPLLIEQIQQFNFSSFFTRLLAWYDQEKRDLPWRQVASPYQVWLSEIMLQQTRVETVIPYYERFVARFPTLASLAAAEEQEVLALWQGLGYYSRARNLHRGAQWIQQMNKEIFPSTVQDLLTVPGIGPYTAGAIASMAYGQPVPAIDGNLCRIFARLWCLPEDMTQGAVRAALSQALTPFWDTSRPGDINQGLMDLSAKICTVNNPQCEQCPLAQDCQACIKMMTEQYPVRKKKKPSPVIYWAIAVIRNTEGGYLLTRRKNQGLLAGLWEFAGASGNSQEEAHQALKKKLADLSLEWEKETLMGAVKHTFTHRIWDMQVFRFQAAADLPTTVNGHHWLQLETLDAQHLLAGPHRKIAVWLKEELI